MISDITGWEKFCIGPATPLNEILRTIDASSAQVALVVDEESRLLGIVTDGDIRRRLLQAEYSFTAQDVMTKTPKTVSTKTSPTLALQIMQQQFLQHLPIVDEGNRLRGIWLLRDLLKTEKYPNSVVLMAGGKGTRLKHLTESTPKPLLKVGKRPILECILEKFITSGFCKFYISVNYLSHMIVDYFGNGEKWGVSIEYLHEKKPLGTAGALSLLPQQEHPFFVMNGDILAFLDFRMLLQAHEEQNSALTIATKSFSYQVPYGVLCTDGNNYVTDIQEKPTVEWNVSSGIYVVSPVAQKLVPKNIFFDMPHLFGKIQESTLPLYTVKIDGYWLDIGQLHDYERAKSLFAAHQEEEI